MLSFIIFLLWLVPVVLWPGVRLLIQWRRSAKLEIRWLDFLLRKAAIAIGWGFVLFTIDGLLRFWAHDLLYFQEDLEQISVLWTNIVTRVILFVVAGVAGFGILRGILRLAEPNALVADEVVAKKERSLRRIVFAGCVVVAFSVGLYVANRYMTVLVYFKQVPFGHVDPVYGKDLAFYVFTLPFVNMVVNTLIALVLLGMCAVVGEALIHAWANERIRIIPLIAAQSEYDRRYRSEPIEWVRIWKDCLAIAKRPLMVLFGFFVLLLGVVTRIGLWNLLYSPRGAVYGAGYTDIHVQRPVSTTLMTLFFVLGAALIVAAFVRTFRGKVLWRSLAIGSGVIGLFALLVVWVYPNWYEKERTSGSQLRLERDPIVWHGELTRFGYGLDRLQTIRFNGDGIPAPLTAETLSRHEDVLSDVRLLDWWILHPVLDQTQAIRTYYAFADIDITRVEPLISGAPMLRQVMVSLREMDQDRLITSGGDRYSRKFVYTHGKGFVVAPTNTVDAEGRPILWVKDIPQQSAIPELEGIESNIYFGEKALTRVYVNTRVKEFDYPLGESDEEGATNHYSGGGGIRLGSGLRRLAFALDEDGMWLLLSKEVTDSTRVLFDRTIHRKVSRLAPFLLHDEDDFPAFANGRAYMVLDTYTATDRLPYSLPFDGSTIGISSPFLMGNKVNYVRNAVKWTLDLESGDLRGYVADPNDPLIQTVMRIYPGMLRPYKEMPVALQEQMRWPEDLFTVQAKLLALYHIKDPQKFLSSEDRMRIALQSVSDEHGQMGTEEMEPTYLATHLPQEPSPEYLCTLLMTPWAKNDQSQRNNLEGWFVARCNRGHLGELRLYMFSKQSLVDGPLLFENRVNAIDRISRELTWLGDPRRGSRIQQAKTIILTLGNSILYVKPYYLRATSGTGIPQLVRVAVGTQDRIGWANTFEHAIADMMGVAPITGGEIVGVTDVTPPSVSDDRQQLLQRAFDVWNRYLAAGQAGDFGQEGTLKAELARIMTQLTQAVSDSTSP